tara:strand:+ start:56 stop:334 length:279 start_codon:yes stop_codon:yes gene_type:complete
MPRGKVGNYLATVWGTPMKGADKNYLESLLRQAMDRILGKVVWSGSSLENNEMVIWIEGETERPEMEPHATNALDVLAGTWLEPHDLDIGAI